jgi:hypothetical protein
MPMTGPRPGRRGRVDTLYDRQQRGVDVAPPQVREHGLFEDGLSLRVHHRVSRSGVQLHLPVTEARIEVDQDDETVADASPSHIPLVEEGGRVTLGLLEGVALGLDLRVHHHLRTRPFLDGRTARTPWLLPEGLDPVAGVERPPARGWHSRCIARLTDRAARGRHHDPPR